MSNPIDYWQQQLWVSILRRRRAYLSMGRSLQGLRWAVSVMAMGLELFWIRLTAWFGSGANWRRYRWLRRVWEWVFRRLGMVVVPVLPLTTVKGRIWLYPRVHATLDVGVMFQLFPMGVLFPVPLHMLNSSILEAGPFSKWGREMTPFSYPDLGSTTQLSVIRSLLKRGYSVAVPINPSPQHPETIPTLGIEPGVISLLETYDDIWLVNFLELRVMDMTDPSHLVPVLVMVESLHDVFPKDGWTTQRGLESLGRRCGFKSAVALPNTGPDRG